MNGKRSTSDVQDVEMDSPPPKKPRNHRTSAGQTSNAVLVNGNDDLMEDPADPTQLGDDSQESDDESGDEIADIELEDDEDDLDEEDEDEELETGGARLSPSEIPEIGQRQPTDSVSGGNNQGSLNPEKPTPYVHDAGHLLVTDPNPVAVADASVSSIPTELTLSNTARDAAQSLLNHLLTTCPITSSKTSTSGSGVNMTLPQPNFALPREKRVPVPKGPTKWELFAAKKGIGKNNKLKGQEGEDRAGKMVYDEASGEWVPKWGYKGKNKQGEGDWLVEVDEKAEKKKLQAGEDLGDPRAASRQERVERIRRNERLMRANERKNRKSG